MTVRFRRDTHTKNKKALNVLKKLSQEYSKLHAALSKNLEFFYGVVMEKDGKFRAQFNQIVAATHRLTSSGVPLKFTRFAKPKNVCGVLSP